MNEITQVVVHFADGELLKGTTQDFFPNRPLFHLIPADGGPRVEVKVPLLKAVFFVKSLEGDSGRTTVKTFLNAPAATAHGKKLAIRFKDGEMMFGYTLSYQPGREGFILFPVDPEGNNIRVYVVVAATSEIQAGSAAEALAQKAAAGARRQ